METATLTICRCGWMSIAPNYGAATEMYYQHKAEGDTTRHNPQTVLGVSNPIGYDAMPYFKRKARILADETRALDNLERWKDKGEPERVVGGPRKTWPRRLVTRVKLEAAMLRYAVLGDR